jgi:hypothetical protein
MRKQMVQPMIFCAASAGLLLLSACGSGGETNNLAAIDKQIAQQDIDPALTAPLEDEILVDPALVNQNNPAAVRAPERPLSAPYPIDQAQRAGAPVAQASAALPPDAPIAGACGRALQHGPEWADRLPAEFPAYPGGRVTEAAGANTATCRVRVVSFSTSHQANQVLGWYRDRAAQAGFNHEHERRGADHVLGGINARTDGAYVVIVTPTASGSDVAMIVNNGR